MAVQGLAAYAKYPHHDKLVAALEAVRSADGGFPYIAAAGQPSDPDSTALSLQALLAEHTDPGAAYAALETYQLGCSDPTADRGAYFYPGDRSPNAFATVQAVPAAAGVTLPLPASTLSAAVPVTPCATAAAAGTATGTGTMAHHAAGACSGTSGVTASVDFGAFAGHQESGCALGRQSSGVTATQHAGFALTGTAQYGLAFVCRIRKLPSAAQQSCRQTPPATAYWAFYTASATADTWTYSSAGAASYAPPAGSLEAWAFGDSAKPSLTPAQVRVATG